MVVRSPAWLLQARQDMKVVAVAVLICAYVGVSASPSQHTAGHRINPPGPVRQPGEHIQSPDDSRPQQRFGNDDTGSRNGRRVFGTGSATGNGQQRQRGYETSRTGRDGTAVGRRPSGGRPAGSPTNIGVRQGAEPSSNAGSPRAFPGGDGRRGDVGRGYRSDYNRGFPSEYGSRSGGRGYIPPRWSGEDSLSSEEYGRRYGRRFSGEWDSRSSEEYIPRRGPGGGYPGRGGYNGGRDVPPDGFGGQRRPTAFGGYGRSG